MLVNQRHESWSHERAMFGCLSWGYGPTIHYSSQFNLVLNRAILVEIPVKAVIIVTDCGEERDDQSPGSPNLRFASTPVGMLPENSIVLLMHADGIFENDCFP